jgi:hypothetical protein
VKVSGSLNVLGADDGTYGLEDVLALGNWYDKGIGLKDGEDPSLELTGAFAFTSSGGGVNCEKVTLKTELTGSTADAHIKSFAAEEPGKCEVSGGLVFLTTGTTTLKAITLTGEPTAINSKEESVLLSNIALHYEFNNGFKATLSSIEGEPLIATPDDTTEISSVSLGGELDSTLFAGKVKVSGSLNVLGADDGTYGLTP